MQTEKNYPPGSQPQNWFLYYDPTKGVEGLRIKRHVLLPTGRKTTERLPIKQYRHLLADETELRRFVIRLNGHDPDEVAAKARYEYKHAFISSALLREYREQHLALQIPTAKDAGTMFRYLNEYGLRFFIDKLRLADPLDWHREQDTWAHTLLNKPGDHIANRIFPEGDLKASKVLRQIVYEMNRFLKYLHKKRPREVLSLELDPFTKAVLKDHEARRKLVCEVAETRYIRPDHWQAILDAMKKRDLPWRYAPILAYAYGLRRNESLGQRFTDIRRKHLEVAAQLDYFDTAQDPAPPVHKPLKDKEMRKVPHWLMEPSQAYYLIEQIRVFPVHPDTLTRYFTGLTDELFGPEGRYTYHDIRRTWITNMLKAHEPEEVRLAAGHANIDTTYKHYVKDTRELDGDVFVPKGNPVADF